MKKAWFIILAIAIISVSFDISNVNTEEINIQTINSCYPIK